MLKKTLSAVLACASLFAGPAAMAHGHCGPGWGWGGPRVVIGPGYYAPAPVMVAPAPYYAPPPYYAPAPSAYYYAPPPSRWVVGERLPGYYPGGYAVVGDWRARGLYAPRPGYHWVRSGADYLMVGVATGIIAGSLLAR